MKAGQKDELVPQFWIGDLCSAKNEEELKESKITHVVTVAKELGELKDFDFLSVSVSMYLFIIPSLFFFQKNTM